jgi:drug/metabolite transporter (DMT)-like permease
MRFRATTEPETVEPELTTPEPVAQDSGQASGAALAAVAVCLFATSPVLIFWAAPLSAFEITALRLGIAAVAIGVLARLTGEPILPVRTDLPRFAAFGLVAALHFLCYIASLRFTSIAHSLAIVYTAPIFVALFSALLLKEPIARRKWPGMLVTVLGIAILVGFEPALSARMLLGDALALVSAITFGLYSVAGRSQRTRYSLFTYSGTVYGLAALWLLPAALLTFTPGGFTPRSVLAVLALGLLPLATGHTLYNAALRRTHATVANLIATQEVTGGVLLGWLILGQVPQPNEIVGAAVSLLGIALFLR